MKRNLITALLVVLAVVPCATFAAADSVQLELNALAKQVAASLKENRSLRLGRFVCQGDLPSSFGPEIQRILIREFLSMDVRVDIKAGVELNGEYRPASIDPDVPDSKEMYIRINTRLVNASTGDPINNILINSRAVYGNEVLAKALAVPVHIPPAATRMQENEAIKKRVEAPDYYASGSRIQSCVESPFSVEVLVLDQKDAPNPEQGAVVKKSSQGLPYVYIPRGKYYRLRITNNASYEAAVRVSVDGLDQYIFSDKPYGNEKGAPTFNYRIVRPKSSSVVYGWFRNLSEFDYFVVTEYAKSASAELKRNPDEAGQIAVQFFASWEKDDDKPKDESASRSASDATGREPGGKQEIRIVERHIGAQRDVVGIRYGNSLP